MKNILTGWMYLTLVFPSFSQLTPDEWTQDIRYLQQKTKTEYSFLFKKVTEKEFDIAVESLIKRIPELKDHEIVVGIAELVAMFKYGHTVMWLTAWRYNDQRGFGQLPVNYYAFSDGIYIQGAHKDYANAVGAKVIKVGTMPVEKALEAIKPVVSVENDQFFKAHGIHYLGVPEVLNAKGVINSLEKVDIELEKNGKRFTLSISPQPSFSFPGRYNLIRNENNWLEARSEGVAPLWMRDLDKIYDYTYLQESKTLYIRQSQIQNDSNQKTIEDFYEEVFQFVDKNNVDRMIIDLRLNSGGNNYLNKPVVTGLIKSKINEKGRLYVIIGRRTFSACQNLVNEIENYTNAIFVGEPTAENVNFFGDVNVEILPNSKLPVRLSHAWWQDKDPRDTRQWTAPTIPVELSFDEYRNNYDPTIDIIISASNLEFELDKLLMEQSDDRFLTQINMHLADEKYSFYSWENWINLSGYKFIQEGNPSRAFKLFKLNSERFPESVNVWDSLAEGYWRTGDREKARELYNKVLKMAPGSRVAEHSQMMLDYMNRN